MFKDAREPKKAFKRQNKEDGKLSASTKEEQARQTHLWAPYGRKPQAGNLVGMLMPFMWSIKIK